MRVQQRDRLMYVPVYVIAVLIYITACILQPRFLTWANNVNLLTRITPLLLAGIAQMFVLLTGGIDLSVGAIIGFTNVIAASLPFVDTPANIILWAIIPVIAGLLIGLSNGFIIAHWGFPPFIVTLATSTIWTGATLFIMDVPGGEISTVVYRSLTGKLFGSVPVPLLIIIAVLFLTGFILKKTVFGRSVYAIGGNKQIAVESGINANKIEISVYGVSGMYAALAGMFLSAMMISADPLVGEPYVMNSIAVAVIGGVALSGGRGGVTGILGAAYIFYLIDNILNLVGVSTFYQYVAKGLVIIIALTITSLNSEDNTNRNLFSGIKNVLRLGGR